MANNFASDYVDVATRIREFREAHPEGSLQPANLAQPYTIEKLGDKTYIVVVAAAYRGPDDKLPGIGMAYEQFPGATNFTKNSELQNAETSAWGRAIVAALAADTKKGVASLDEVQNRQAERELPPPTAGSVRAAIARAGERRGWARDFISDDFASWSMGQVIGETTDIELLSAYLDYVQEVKAGETP